MARWCNENRLRCLGITRVDVDMSDNALEAKLRPAVEMYSVMVCMGTALIAVFAPWALLMPRPMGLITAALLILFATLRFRQGLRVLTYQRNLRRLPTFTLSATKIPVSPDKLFLGMGFMWETEVNRHYRNAKVSEIGAGTREIRRIIIATELLKTVRNALP